VTQRAGLWLKNIVLAALLYGLLVQGSASAQASTATAGAGLGLEAMILAVSLNTEGKGDLFVSRTPDGDFLLKATDLIAMGFTAPTGVTVLVDAEPHISLRSIRGLTFNFNEKTLALAITADPRLLPTNAIELGVRPHLSMTRSLAPSAFFNYAFSRGRGVTPDNSDGDFAGEMGLRLGEYLLLSNSNTVPLPDGGTRHVRLMTTVTRDNMENLQRFVGGDFFAPSRELGNGATLGGIGVSKLYDLDPYMIRSPAQNITGVTALPSDLEIYVDGQKVRTERVKPGSFELRDLVAYGGARSVQVYLRDPFGRVQQLDYPFYFTDQPLRRGLHEYNYGFGALRRNFGVQSNEYGPAAYAMFHRYGVTDAVTLGVRAEGRRGLSNAGPLATVVLGTAGVVNLALAASSIEGTRGYAGLLSYSYQSSRWTLGASLRRDSRRYVALGDPVSISNRKFDGNFSAGYNLPDHGSISLSHSVVLAHAGQGASPASPTQPYAIEALDNSRVTTLSYSTPLSGGKASLVANLSRVKQAQQRSNELFVGMTYYLDRNLNVATSYQQNGESRVTSVQINRPQPVGEGIGYDIAADHTQGAQDRSTRLALAAQYNAPAAVLRAEYGRLSAQGPTASSSDNYRLTLSGGVAYVAGTWALGRPVTDSFGVVKVGKVEGVPVTVNGQDSGKTDAQGRLFIPSLSSYHDNQIVIAPENMPMEYSFSTTVKRVSPPQRSGVVVDFDVVRIQGTTGKLQLAEGDALRPVEFQEISLQVQGRQMTLPTGRGGEFYVENLSPGNYPATVTTQGKSCGFELVIPVSDAPFIDVGDVLCKRLP
jgi:outer membrane usher protein